MKKILISTALLIFGLSLPTYAITPDTSGNLQKKVKVSSNDTTSGFLNGKLVGGSNITLTETNDGGEETLVIASTASGTGTMSTIKEGDAQVGDADIGTIDFGSGFDVAESPDTEVNVSIDLSEIVSGDITATVNNLQVVDDSHNHVIGNIDSFSEADLEGKLSDVSNMIVSTEIDSYSEINTIVSDVTLTHNGLIDTFSELDAIVADKSLINTADAKTITATWTLEGVLNADGATEGVIRAASSTTLPATCTVGDLYLDTDADTDGSLFACVATNTWKEIDDDGGAGGGGDITDVYNCASGDCSNITMATGDILNGGDGLIELPNGTATVGADCNETAETGRIFVDTDDAVGLKLYVCTGVGGWEQQGIAAGDTFAIIQADGTTISTNAPTLDFDAGDFTLTESPTDDFDIVIAIDTEAELEAQITDMANIIQATEIDTKTELESIVTDVNNFAEADGDTYTGQHDFGAADDLEIPNGAAPTVDVNGQIATDSTEGDLVYFAGGEERVTTNVQFKNFTIENPTDADNFLLFKAPYALTITDVDCIVDPADTAESAVIDIQERDSVGDTPVTIDATITCDNDGAADDGTLTNPSIDSGDWVSVDIGTVTGTVSQVSGTIKYKKTRV